MPIRAIALTFHLTSSVGLRFELSVADEFSCKRSKDAIAPLQLAVAIILEELEDEIQWDTVDYVAREA